VASAHIEGPLSRRETPTLRLFKGQAQGDIYFEQPVLLKRERLFQCVPKLLAGLLFKCADRSEAVPLPEVAAVVG